MRRVDEAQQRRWAYAARFAEISYPDGDSRRCRGRGRRERWSGYWRAVRLHHFDAERWGGIVHELVDWLRLALFPQVSRAITGGWYSLDAVVDSGHHLQKDLIDGPCSGGWSPW